MIWHDLAYYAEKVRYYNEQKDAVRGYLQDIRDTFAAQSDNPTQTLQQIQLLENCVVQFFTGSTDECPAETLAFVDGPLASGTTAQPVLYTGTMSDLQGQNWVAALQHIELAGLLPAGIALPGITDQGNGGLSEETLEFAVEEVERAGDGDSGNIDLSGLPCNCVGTDFVCTDRGQTVSFPNHPLCGGAGSGACFCAGADLVCADGSITTGGCG